VAEAFVANDEAHDGGLGITDLGGAGREVDVVVVGPTEAVGVVQPDGPVKFAKVVNGRNSSPRLGKGLFTTAGLGEAFVQSKAVALLATQGRVLPLLDLNQELMIPDEASIGVFSEDARPILGVADTRLNNEGKGPKMQSWGLARLAVPLKKSLLCAPPARDKHVLPKKLVPDAGGRSSARASKASVPHKD
jgi:hypothetical protein